MQNNYPPITVKFADRKRYYGEFDSYYRDDDAGAMVQIVAKYVKNNYQRATEEREVCGLCNTTNELDKYLIQEHNPTMISRKLF